MGALFDGPYRAIAKTGLRPVLTIRPLTLWARVSSFTNSCAGRSSTARLGPYRLERARTSARAAVRPAQRLEMFRNRNPWNKRAYSSEWPQAILSYSPMRTRIFRPCRLPDPPPPPSKMGRSPKNVSIDFLGHSEYQQSFLVEKNFWSKIFFSGRIFSKKYWIFFFRLYEFFLLSNAVFDADSKKPNIIYMKVG